MAASRNIRLVVIYICIYLPTVKMTNAKSFVEDDWTLLMTGNWLLALRRERHIPSLDPHTNKRERKKKEYSIQSQIKIKLDEK